MKGMKKDSMKPKMMAGKKPRADGIGRMMGGGKTVLAEDGMNKISGYAKGKKVMHYADGGITMTSRGCGAARKQKFGKNG